MTETRDIVSGRTRGMPIRSQRTRRNSRARERGASIPEMLVSMFLLSVVSLVIYQLYIGTMRVNMFQESHNDLAAIGQRAVNELKEEVLQSRIIFQENTIGQGYRAALDLPPSAPVLSGSLLPVVDSSGSIVPDTTIRRVGNSLLLAREQLPEPISIDHDADPATPDVEYLADLYRFEFVYLTPNDSRDFSNLGYYIDLMMARSERYADYFQLDGWSPTARTEAAKALYAQGLRYAWDPAQGAGSAFYSIDSSGTLTGPSAHTIAVPDVKSMMPEFRGGRVSGSMTYSIGPQLDPPLDASDPVNAFAQPTGLFPSGFEVLIIGPSGSRQVMARLALFSQYGNKLNSHVNTVIATTSEF